jgi:dephospho-CoA kinase
MIRVGVTGGIGSGKSVVCSIFRNLDIEVYDADREAKRIIAEDPGVRKKLIQRFGEGIFRDSELDRKFLAEKIFTDPDARSFVNGLVHPKIWEDFSRWTQNKEGPYVIEEAALLFESGAWEHLDFNILVLAEDEIRIDRIMKRDHSSREEVRSRMSAQIDPAEASEMADFRIRNDGNEFLIPQVLEADRMIRDRLLDSIP